MSDLESEKSTGNLDKELDLEVMPTECGGSHETEQPLLEGLECLSHAEIIDAARRFTENHHKRFNEEPTFSIAGEPTSTPPPVTPLPVSDVALADFTNVMAQLHAIGLSNKEIYDLILIVDPTLRPFTLPSGNKTLVIFEPHYALMLGLSRFLNSKIAAAKQAHDNAVQFKQSQARSIRTQKIGIFGTFIAALIVAWIVSLSLTSTVKVDDSSFQPILTELQSIREALDENDLSHAEQQLDKLVELAESYSTQIPQDDLQGTEENEEDHSSDQQPD